MATTQPFAYNTGTTIPSTTQIGDLAIGLGDLDYSDNYGGVQWWMGPDEDTKYVISSVRPSGQPVPAGVTGTAQVGFWGSKFKTEESFLNLANYIGGKNGQPPFATANDATTWLNANGYYTSFSVPTPTPTSTLSITPTSTATITPTPSVTNTQTPSATPTFTPTPSTSPVPVTGYGYNLVALPYNLPTSGNSIMNADAASGQTGTTLINELTITNRGFYFSSIDSIGVDRTSYFSQFTGQSITITFTQNGDSAIYSGDTNAFKSTTFTGGTGFVFGTEINVGSGASGNAVIIQSASTTWVTGDTVYVSAVINGEGVTPTPTATNTQTPTVTPTNTETPTNTPTPSVTNTQTPTSTTTETPTPTPTPTSAPFAVSMVESGSDVVLSYSGILDLTGLDYVQDVNAGGGGVGPSTGTFGIGPSGTVNVSLYTGATFSYPSSFGAGGGGGLPYGSGNYFGVFGGLLPTNCVVVPSGYTSGNYIQGTTTLSASTFSSLGMNTGTYNYSWGAGAGQSFVLTIGGVGVTPTPTATSVTPTPTPTLVIGGWLFYTPEGAIQGPPSSSGNTIFVGSDGYSTFNPNYTGGTFNIYFNQDNTAGTSYLTQFQGLDASGGTLTISQGSNTVIYSGSPSQYNLPGNFLGLAVNSSAQMIQSASTPFVSGTTINVVVS